MQTQSAANRAPRTNESIDGHGVNAASDREQTTRKSADALESRKHEHDDDDLYANLAHTD